MARLFGVSVRITAFVVCISRLASKWREHRSGPGNMMTIEGC